MKVINLWGGPGSGKSTTAAGLFSIMKLNKKRVELVTEFAKDLTYEKNFITLSNQLKVTGEQDHRLRRLEDHVEYVITDSPLPTGLMYATGVYKAEWFTNCVIGAFNSYNNINFFIHRVKPYVNLGRTQTEDESNEISQFLLKFLTDQQLEYQMINGDEYAANTIYSRLFPE